MKKVGVLLSLTFAIVLLGGNALAQNVGDNSVYFVTYYAHANTAGVPDGVVRVINDGGASTAEVEGVANGNLWASIYVFDDSEELQECCSCFVSADGLLSESVNQNLTANELTGRAENTRGVIKVISSASNDPTNNMPKPGLRVLSWSLGASQSSSVNSNAVNEFLSFSTETEAHDSNLVPAEKSALESSCSFAMTLGSGAGVCSCTPEDHDF
jgi:hypothetical protein